MRYFLLVVLSIIFFNIDVYAQNDITAADCPLSMKLVEKDSFVVLNGWKVIATVAVEEFDRNFACWLALEKEGEKILGSQTFGGVYFFDLQEDEIPEIENEYHDFNQMGMNLLGKYWRRPSYDGALIRFPNNQ